MEIESNSEEEEMLILREEVDKLRCNEENFRRQIAAITSQCELLRRRLQGSEEALIQKDVALDGMKRQQDQLRQSMEQREFDVRQKLAEITRKETEITERERRVKEIDIELERLRRKLETTRPDAPPISPTPPDSTATGHTLASTSASQKAPSSPSPSGLSQIDSLSQKQPLQSQAPPPQQQKLESKAAVQSLRERHKRSTQDPHSASQTVPDPRRNDASSTSNLDRGNFRAALSFFQSLNGNPSCSSTIPTTGRTSSFGGSLGRAVTRSPSITKKN